MCKTIVSYEGPVEALTVPPPIRTGPLQPLLVVSVAHNGDSAIADTVARRLSGIGKGN